MELLYFLVNKMNIRLVYSLVIVPTFEEYCFRNCT